MSDIRSIPEEQRIRLLVNAVTDYAIYMLDSEGQVATWNPGAQRFKGYMAEEIIGQHFSRFFTEEDRAAGLPERALATAAREGRFEAEGWRVRKDGTRFWAHAVLDPVLSEEGELIGFAKITRDITDRREREQALYQSEQRFRMLVEGVSDYAIYMLDTDGRITNWNSGAAAIKGYSADEIIGEHFSRFYTEEDRAKGEPERALETALREGKYEREARRVRKDGTLFWANVVIDPIFDDTGKHVGFAKITRDVTERKLAGEELEKAREALAQSQRLQALGELAGGVAHDFNNLMTVILGSTDFLLHREDLPKDKARQYLEAIHETATRATALTDQLLAFGRRRPLKLEVVEVDQRLRGLSEVLARTIGSQVEVLLDLGAQGARVEVDAAQLETAVLNAVLNARDAMPGGGTLTLATTLERERQGDLIRINIRDTGHGMSHDVLERAFDPFFTTKQIGKGTGLGLSQVHGFAAQAGGRAEIASKEGEGTKVSILLPRTDKAVAAAAPEPARASLPKGLKVLLVEDNDHVREFATELLEDLGCAVISASSGEEALEQVDGNAVDLVLSDVMMPGLSGLELANVLRERHPGLPVLLATGYSDELAFGQSEYAVVLKPFGAQELSEAVAAIFTNKGERAA